MRHLIVYLEDEWERRMRWHEVRGRDLSAVWWRLLAASEKAAGDALRALYVVDDRDGAAHTDCCEGVEALLVNKEEEKEVAVNEMDLVFPNGVEIDWDRQVLRIGGRQLVVGSLLTFPNSKAIHATVLCGENGWWCHVAIFAALAPSEIYATLPNSVAMDYLGPSHSVEDVLNLITELGELPFEPPDPHRRTSSNFTWPQFESDDYDEWQIGPYAGLLPGTWEKFSGL